MTEALAYAYLGGCGVVTLAFGLMLRVLYTDDPTPDRQVFYWFCELAPKYIFCWPWQCVARPIWMCPELRREL